MNATLSPMPPPAGRHDIVISARVAPSAVGRKRAVPLCSTRAPSTVVHAIRRGRSRRVTTDSNSIGAPAGPAITQCQRSSPTGRTSATIGMKRGKSSKRDHASKTLSIGAWTVVAIRT